jgi:hypothetical protein
LDSARPGRQLHTAEPTNGQREDVVVVVVVVIIIVIAIVGADPAVAPSARLVLPLTGRA